MFGLNAPAPDGPPSDELAQLMTRVAASGCFRRKVRLWSWVRGASAFDWERFEVNLNRAEFREFRGTVEAKRSVGWADQNPDNPDPQWLFATCRSIRRVWLLGGSVLAHELFHAVQDVESEGQLFCPSENLRWWQGFFIEAEAMLFGSPLIGAPVLVVLLTCLAGLVLLIVEIGKLVSFFL